MSTASCSFCTRSEEDVRRLVAGPGVFICDECVALCAELVGGPAPRTARPPGDLWAAAPDVGTVLDLLPKVAAAITQAEDNLAQLVRRGRTLGATWAQIGSALGVTRQSAWERFSAPG